MRIGLTASRDGITDAQKAVFVKLIADLTVTVTETHYGDCKNGDEAMLWALVELGSGGVLHSRPATVSLSWDAQWRAHTATRYPELGIIEHPAFHPLVRNRHIVDSVDRLYGCPKYMDRKAASGTWATIRYAQDCGKPAVVIAPDGRVEIL